MKFASRTLLFFLCVAILPARAEFFEFDKVHTQILFFVSHLGFSKSQGEFLEFSGGFYFNKKNYSRSNVKVAIKTASIDMDDAKWNKHMRNKDFFHVDEHSQMVFQSTRVETTGEKTFDIHGELTMLGITRPVVIHTTFNKIGAHPKSGNYVAGFSGIANIKRSDFGMKYALPFVGDDVEIRLEVEGVFQR